jgi:hypothetical protein
MNNTVVWKYRNRKDFNFDNVDICKNKILKIEMNRAWHNEKALNSVASLLLPN